MDCGSSFNLLYADTIREMRINPTRIRSNEMVIKGFRSGVWTCNIENIMLEVVFSTPKNFRREGEIAPFHSHYLVLLRKLAFGNFHVLP